MSIGRIPIVDVQPRVLDGARPAKAVPGERFTVTATVFREGHDAVAANVVLTGPDGERGPWTMMRELAPGTDRYGAEVAADRRGEWTFHVEAWSDPLATWYHDARIKIPAGLDIELVFEQGARLLERAASTIPVSGPGAPTGSSARESRNKKDTEVARATSPARPTSPKSTTSAPHTSAAARSAATDTIIDRVTQALIAQQAARATGFTSGSAKASTASGGKDRPAGEVATAPAAEAVAADPAVRLLLTTAEVLRDTSIPAAGRMAAAEDERVHAALAARPVRDLLTESERCPLRVDRSRALFGSWYEMFPRSEGARIDPSGQSKPISGTLRTAAERLPGIAAMGFDVVYLPPIHPIGTATARARTTRLAAGPCDVGSPWAIGSAEGGHDAIHPDLGTLDDFDHFVAARRASSAWRSRSTSRSSARPTTPGWRSTPSGSRTAPDGTIAYAENPPKKYQDIYPLDFDERLRRACPRRCERILRLWMAPRRADLPGRQPAHQAGAVLGVGASREIHATDPDVIFLAEAFTRPAMMHTLAKVGFQQSYTYFTWRTAKQELSEYLTELSGETAALHAAELLRQHPRHPARVPAARRAVPAFEMRAVLAATLSPTWGVYSGYELCEDTPVRPGSEEYLDSEKYQSGRATGRRPRREGRSPGPLSARLNAVRREHPALPAIA